LTAEDDHPMAVKGKAARYLQEVIVMAGRCSLLVSILFSLFSVLPSVSAFQKVHYSWKVTPVGKTADLLTLFWGSSDVEATEGQVTPLVAVLRDDLGFDDPEDDRISFIWLLPHLRPTVGQHILSAVPFFYWSSRRVPQKIPMRDMSPLLDLTTPEQSVMSGLRRNLLQWALFDQMASPIRSVSRAQGTNRIDEQRLHLEEAITYLQHAPVSDDRRALTRTQLDALIARLALRKQVLGGFVNEQSFAQVSEERSLKQERIRERNWEVLRQCADKTSLLFEPLNLAGERDQYAILWFPVTQSPPTIGISLDPIWKLLNIKDPWSDPQLRHWNGRTYYRSLDENGTLLPAGGFGIRTIPVVPLCVYSLTYPKVPLLLVDFREQRHVRRHEILQRSMTEVLSGVLGVSRFTNWYYYLALSLYEFVSARHGTAVKQEGRLDSYARFRVELTLDRTLDPVFQEEIKHRMDSLIVNPLANAPDCEMQVAARQYVVLEAQSEDNGHLMERVRKARRSEIASFGQNTRSRVTDDLLYVGSLGLYQHRAEESLDNISKLDCYRRVAYQLRFLDSVVAAGTPPEVAYDIARLHASITELENLMPRVQSPGVRAHARNTLLRLSGLSRNLALQDECSLAIASFRSSSMATGVLVLKNSSAGVAPSKGVASAK
jgi:hypothetical protein